MAIVSRWKPYHDIMWLLDWSKKDPFNSLSRCDLKHPHPSINVLCKAETTFAKWVIQDVLWKSGFSRLYSEMPSRKLQPNEHKDACRLNFRVKKNKHPSRCSLRGIKLQKLFRVHGVLTLNKVAGNFHITAGKVNTYFKPKCVFLANLQNVFLKYNFFILTPLSGPTHHGCARSHDWVHGNFGLQFLSQVQILTIKYVIHWEGL